MTDNHASDTAVGAAANPTDMLPTQAQDTPALAWADDNPDQEDHPVPASWGAVFNYAAFLIICGLIAAAITAGFVWFGDGAR
ncbi:hypothetical protein OEM_20100 [Mycobacterium intracellulare subsp. yongonense 05-1390]|uniref:hypothetical protein n=1 Tax=Mycobacterium TaxID=1763 RepID=UPI00025D574B|nr:MULTISPECIES: hypothetical protein [Mycobacterium]AFJ35060.1 hypothetical protein W7S_10445 [Mycobacterium sp. MOTT36Y]AGP63545.1 hypothetical protein OEM_20100 [Mycobacterium intracellulare subsp. yongonense 05-1390]ELR84803.1 hypothetical protein W7U_06215 [Mycobacterium sp. H4Y]PBA55284.1 hypothetical protein CKJ57_11535 [Mycobacterium intracellulare subsp. chimaera]